jgi:hypothetical protein
MTSPDSRNATSSPGSEDGPSQHAWPDGTTLDLFGAPPAPVSHSRKLANGAEPMIQGICGRTYIGSSTPPGPLSSWENRLRERLASIGSTESALIWRPQATPAGLLTSRLSPSTLHTNGTGSIGSPWPTPNSRETGGGSYADPANAAARRDAGHQVNLQDVMVASASRALWPTVTAGDGGLTSRSGDRKGELLIGGMMRAASWITPSARDWKDTHRMEAEREDGRERVDQLPRQMIENPNRATWTTPTATDAKQVPYRMANGRKCLTLDGQVRESATAHGGPEPSGSPVTTTRSGGSPTPAHPCWLMGFEAAFLFTVPLQSELRTLNKARRSPPTSG